MNLSIISDLYNYFINNSSDMWGYIIEHLNLTFVAVLIAILIGVPLGILINYFRKTKKPVLGSANIIQAIPSMALLGFFIPIFGIGSTSAIIAVVLYSLLPIVKNTYTGISNINSQTLEAAKGIGLTKFQILYKIQIPMSLPVIMSGIRIAAVTAVGLMTIAAYIGAGGLGYLIFAGIRTMDNVQILAGAIPACLLALAIDFILNIVEKTVTPMNMIQIKKPVNLRILNFKKLAIASLFIISSIVVTLSYISVDGKDDYSITIGSKDFTEQAILGNMVADIIEYNSDITVYREMELGGTQVIFSALQTDDIDMYIEYSGTAYTAILGQTEVSDIETVYNYVKEELYAQYEIEALDYMNFNNTYALATTKEIAELYDLETISDLQSVDHLLTTGTTFEFLNREDGLPGVEETYNLSFKENVAIDNSARYTALLNGDVEIIDAFTTDGLLAKHDLVVLEDDLSFFPPYNTTPILKKETLEQFPELETLIQPLYPLLTNEVMTLLNYEVDIENESPSDVARNFLLEEGLITI